MQLLPLPFRVAFRRRTGSTPTTAGRLETGKCGAELAMDQERSVVQLMRQLQRLMSQKSSLVRQRDRQLTLLALESLRIVLMLLGPGV